METVHADDAVAAVHCCGNTEWSILIDAGVDIVSFDAFTYGETIALYPDYVKALLEGGGALAWGVVPTSASIREYTVENLKDHLEKLIDNLSKKGIDRNLILEQALITPSCGTGSMENEDAVSVFDKTAELSELMRETYR